MLMEDSLPSAIMRAYCAAIVPQGQPQTTKPAFDWRVLNLKTGADDGIRTYDLLFTNSPEVVLLCLISCSGVLTVSSCAPR